ncbi:MAG: T9SS type A sorting domain-containing protein [Cytophagaceae bacterium]
MKHLLLIVALFCALQSIAQKKIISQSETRDPFASKSFGSKVVSLGDVNGDSKFDVGIYDPSSSKFYIYSGNGTGIDNSPSQTLNLSYWKQLPIFNNAGDINGDHINDLVIGLPDSSKVIVYYGTLSGFSTSPDIILQGFANAKFGFSFDYTCDLNADGYADLVIGEPYRQKTNSYTLGLAYVYYGKATGISSNPDVTINKGGAYILFGYTIAKAGDVNNDGYDDVLITGKKNISDISYKPFVMCFYGGPSGVEPNITSKQWTRSDFSSDLNYGVSAGSCGDINNDGYDDIFINSFNATTKMIILGTASGLSSTKTDFIVPGFFGNLNYSNNFFTKAGDFNKDGYGDLACISSYTVKNVSYRRVNVFRGTQTGIETMAWFQFEFPQLSNSMSQITFADDINGDGYDDLLLGEITPSDSLAGRFALLQGTFDLYAKIAADTTWLCHANNSFKFFNRSPKLYSQAILKPETANINLTDTVHNYSFTQPGWHRVKLTVRDNNNNSHTDSIRIFAQPLYPSGNYDLGNGKFFSSVPMLNDSLRCGIAGDISVSIDPAIYDHTLKLENAKNISTFHKLIISGNSGLRNTFISGLSIVNFPNVHVNNITFFDTLVQHNSFPKPVIVNNSDNVSFDNCRFYYFKNYNNIVEANLSKNLKITNSIFSVFSDTSNRYVSFKAYTYALNANSCDSLILKHNRVYMHNGDYGLTIGGGNFITVENNIVRGRNPKDGAYNNESAYGIKLGGVQGIRVLNNRITGCSEGLILTGISGKPNADIVANNAIGGDIGEYNYSIAQHGLHVLSCQNLKVYHNTVHYSNNGGTYNGSSFGEKHGFAFHLISSHNINIKNNLFIATGKPSGSVALTEYHSSSISSDFNVLQGLLNNGGYHDDYYELPKYIKDHKKEYNSVLLDSLEFEHPFLLRPVNRLNLIANKVPVLPEVPLDITGTPRNEGRTNAGAYVLNIPDTVTQKYINASIASISTPTLQLGNNLIKVKIANYRPEPMDSLYIHYSVNGEHIARETWYGSLNNGDTTEFSFFAPFNCKRKRLYTIKAWVEIPASYIDMVSSNDTLQKEYTIKMDGEYYVLCDTCIFKTLTEANYNLKRCGVENLVTFLITPGDYSDQMLTIENGPVIYKSSTGNPQDVKFQMHGMYLISKAEIRDITISPRPGQFGFGFNFQGITLYVCDSITFKNCIFQREGNYKYALSYIRCKGINVLDCKFENFDCGINFSAYTYYGSNEFDGTFLIKGNSFKDVNNAILFDGSTRYSTCKVNVENNLFYGGNYSIYFYNYRQPHNNIDIYGNTFFSNNCIYSGGTDVQNVKIYNNTIRAKGGIPVNLQGWNYVRQIYIFNNVIITESPSSYVSSIYLPNTQPIRNAIYLDKIQYGYVYHNTCVGGVKIGYGTANTNVTIKNNIFSSENDIMGIYPNTTFNISNNCLFRKDGNWFVQVQSYYYNTIASLHQTYPSVEVSSVSIDPLVGISSFRSTATDLKGKGTQVTKLYRFDINGIERDTINPDLGAHVINTIPLSLPVVSTGSISDFSESSVNISGHASNDGGSWISEKGFCYSTSPNPTINDTRKSAGCDIGDFSETVTGLASNTVYYLRAYAVNSDGVSYGNVITFSTGVTNIQENQNDNLVFSVYPNPSTGIINLHLNQLKSDNLKVKLVNTQGIVVFEEKFESYPEIVTITSDHLAKGFYFMEIICGEDVLKEKIVLE